MAITVPCRTLAELWRKRAEEVRVIASLYRSVEAKAQMIRLAQTYDYLAEVAEAEKRNPA